jgi:50S ribosomal protein L16 3-hydroxylase
MSQPFLDRILGGVSRDAFRRQHWEKEPLITHGPLSRFSPLPELVDLGTVEALTNRYRSPIMVLGKLAIRETEGISDRVSVLPGRALDLYREGATLEFDCLDMFVPEVRGVLEQLSKDLGVPDGTFGKAIGYLSAKGSGVSPHFDAYVNFVLQLRGTKKWSLLKNTTAEYPLEHYALDELPFVPEELATYWSNKPPANYFAEAKDVVLKPGDLMFVPRGVWHATEAGEESFSVNFNFSVPTWLEVALASLRLKMAGIPALRALADSTPSNQDGARAALAAVLGSPDADALLRLRTEEYDRYQVAGAVFRQLLKLDS